MNQKYVLQRVVLFLILISNIGCDQWSKEIVRHQVDENQIIPVISSYFTITKVENTGAFLSAGSDLPEFLKFVLLAFIPVLSLSFGLLYLFKRKDLSWLSGIALAFAIGGGIGNIYDRIIFGSVTDFMHLDFGIFQTGIFNMADVSIMFGMLLFLLQSFIQRSSSSNTIAKS